jgi:hypothetical protein
MMNVPPAVLENWTTFPAVEDPRTVRTFAAAAGVAIDVTVAAVTVPVNVGPAERTTDPVPVEVVTPVPPRPTANVPDTALPMFRSVIADPAPIKVVALTVAAVTVPVNVGSAERTTDPDPVEVVTPVPPRATANVPDPALPMFRAVIPDPAPVKVVALTVAAFIVPVKTSRAVAGLFVPMPMFPIPTRFFEP